MQKLVLVLMLVLLGAHLNEQSRLRVTPAVIACDLTADNASQSAVETKITASVDGQVVCIPAGTATWTGTTPITKAITLRGAGIGQTVITDGVVSRNAPIIAWTLVANKTSRMTAIEFEGDVSGAQNTNGVITVSGSNADSRRMRIDHNRFDELRGMDLFTRDTLGVLDNNQFYKGPTAGGIFVYIYHQNWDGYTFSDGSRADTVDVNAEDFLYLEDNVFEYHDRVYAIADAYRGARYVVRHNTIYNGWIEAHGTDSGGRAGGTRAVLVYNNAFVCNDGQTCDYVGNMRSATGLFQDNTTTGYTAPHITLSTYRVFYPFEPWGPADGTVGWDVNLGGGPFASGTATGGGTGNIVDSGASFSGLTGYVVRRTSCVGYCASVITSHTGTQLNFADGGGYPVLHKGVVQASPAPTTTTATVTGNAVTEFTVGENIKTACDANCSCSGDVRRITANVSGAITWTPAATTPIAAAYICEHDLTFASGEGYEVYKPTEVFDQPGRGQGTRLLARTVSGCTESGTTVTCTTNSAHGYATNDWVALADLSSSLYRGTYQITVTGATTFTYTSPFSGLSASDNNGTVTKMPATNDEVDEPFYECNNSQGATNIDFTVVYTAQIRVNEHYFQNTCNPAFTGYTYPHPLTVTP